MTKFLFLIFLISCCYAHESKLVFQVEPTTEDCYFLEINEKQVRHPVTVDINVIRGGLLDILLEVKFICSNHKILIYKIINAHVNNLLAGIQAK
jgi:hypothetical protein